MDCSNNTHLGRVSIARCVSVFFLLYAKEFSTAYLSFCLLSFAYGKKKTETHRVMETATAIYVVTYVYLELI